MDMTTLDREFSLLVRSLSDWICTRCGRNFASRPEELHCSHFHSRRHMAVRFDFDNCDALCWECHDYFDHHPAEHAAWKLEQLGCERFDALQESARRIVKLDKKSVRANLRNFKFQAA